MRQDSLGSALAALTAYYRRSRGDIARGLARAFGGIAKSVDADLTRITGVDISGLLPAHNLDEIVQLNTNLITTVGRAHVEHLARVYRERDLAALHQSARTKIIQAELGVSESRAKFWARDQSSKYHADTTRTRAQAVGITRYRWVTSSDERVRDEHGELDGQIFSFDDPPITNEAGDTNNPGGDYNCRCIAEVVLE